MNKLQFTSKTFVAIVFFANVTAYTMQWGKTDVTTIPAKTNQNMQRELDDKACCCESSSLQTNKQTNKQTKQDKKKKIIISLAYNGTKF